MCDIYMKQVYKRSFSIESHAMEVARKNKTRYACPRCGLATNHKGNFMEHLTRKRRCEPLVADVDVATLVEEMNKAYNDKPHGCSYCDKRFSHKPTMYAHQNTCSSNPAVCRHLQPVPTEARPSDPTSPQPMLYIYTPANANVSFITRSAYAALVKPVRRQSRLKLSLVSMVKIVFLNPLHPENFCTYVPNKKLKKAVMWEGTSWKTYDLEDAVREIRNVAYGLLADFFDETQHDYERCTQDEWRAFFHRVTAGDDSTIFKQTDRDVSNAMIDFSPTVKAHIKNRKACSPARKYEDEI
jgi:hypothetical protein